MLDKIIELYEFSLKTIKLSQNPRTHLIVINNFFKTLQEYRLNHLTNSFLNDFIDPLVKLFKNTNVEFLSPEELNFARFLINRSIILTDNDIIKHDLKSILYQININLLLVYYYLGEAENGKIILEEIINNKFIEESGYNISGFTENIKVKISKENDKLIDPYVFKRNIIFDVLQKINYEIHRINSFSGDSINVLMVESENIAGKEWFFGSVMELCCDIENKINNNVTPIILDNITDINDNSLNSAINNIWTSSKLILNKFKSILNETKIVLHLRFHKLSGVYKGASYGSGAAILIPASVLKYLQSRYNVQIAFSAAFSGAIDQLGTLQKMPDSVLKYKIEAAFFSWIKNIIIPESNYSIALEYINTLKNKYPRKIINIVSVKNISEVLINRDIVLIKKDKLSEYLKKFVTRHKYLSYSVISAVLIAITFIAAWNLIPRNIKPLPQSQNYLNLFYTPDREAKWIFQNSDREGVDTITFGEIAVGDMLTHRIALWNNSESKKPIKFEIGGKDSSEFEVLWAIDPAQKEAPEFIYNDIRQRVYLKFIPWRDTGSKSAILKIYSSDDQNNYKLIYLKGKSGYFENGYSLKMKNDDEYVIYPKLGNFLGDEFSITLWFKANKPKINLLNDDNSNHTDTKFCLLVDYDTTIGLQLLESGSMQTYSHKIVSKNKVKLSEWNNLAVTHKKNITKIYLNGIETIYKTQQSHFKQIEDFFFLGSEVHPMQRASNIYRKDDWELSIAELKIFKNELNFKDLNSVLNTQSNYTDDRLKLYHNYEESVGHFVQDASKNDIPGELFGLTEKSLDHPKIKRLSEIPKVQSNIDKFVKIFNKGEIRLNKNIFIPKTSFTIQFEAKAGGKLIKNWRKFYHLSGIQYSYGFSFINSGFIVIERGDYINDIFWENQNIHFKLDTNWHKYTFDYNHNLNTGSLFIDSKKLAEYSLGNSDYDITRQFFCIIFGKEGQYDNPRFWGEPCSVDNISIFNKTLSQEEINLNNPDAVKSIPGLLALWTFNNINYNICYDEINKVPVFIWDEFEILKK